MHAIPVALGALIFSLAAADAGEVRLSVDEPTGVGRQGWPVTSGVPLARGALGDERSAALDGEDGREIPLQATALSRWPDGSIRWLLLDFSCDLKASQKKNFVLHYGPQTRRAAVPDPVTVSQENGEAVVTTGPLRMRLSPQAFRLLDGVWLDANGDGKFSDAERVTTSAGAGILLTTPDGQQFRADQADAQLSVEESGPLRASVRVDGRHQSSHGTMFRYVVRLQFFRGRPFVRVDYTFINDSPDALMAQIKSIELAFAVAKGRGTETILDGRERTGGQLLQVDDTRYELNGKPAGRRGQGWAAVAGNGTGLAVGVREFWQNWPKGIDVTADRIRVGICPALPGKLYDAKPLNEECKLYYYLRNGRYSFKVGVARTHELWATFFAGKPDFDRLSSFFRATEKPLLAQCRPEYVAACGAVGTLTPSGSKNAREYDALAEGFFEEHLAERDRVREYGLLNYGDWYDTAWDAWGNLEYDTARIWFQQYLRTGDRRYFDRAEQAARHFIDVDVMHAVNPQVQAYPGSAGMRPGQIWAHSVGHTGGYYGSYQDGKYAGLAPLKLTGAYQLGLYNFGHVWVGGAFDYYLLTGERRARDVAVQVSDTMADLCPTRYTDHIRNIGWPMHLLLNAYEATADKKYLAAAGKEWEVLKKHLDPKAGWVVLLPYGYCPVLAEAGRCRGNNMYMLGFTLTALARYHRVTGDPEVLKALTIGLNQMVREGWSERDSAFYLTSCRHSRNSPPLSFNTPAFHSSEAFAYEAALTGNKEHLPDRPRRVTFGDRRREGARWHETRRWAKAVTTAACSFSHPSPWASSTKNLEASAADEWANDATEPLRASMFFRSSLLVRRLRLD